MITKSDLAANHAVILDGNAATNTGLGSDNYSLADVAVVTYMDQVIELRSPPYPSLSQGRTIHARMRTYLDIVFDHYRSYLRKLVIAHVVPHITKAVRANTYSGVKNNAITKRDTVIEHDVGVQYAVPANGDVLSNEHAGFNLRACTNLRSVFYGDVRTDEYRQIEFHVL